MRTKLSIYLLFLRAVLMYAAPAFWNQLAPDVIKRLEAFQSITPVSYTHLDVYKRQASAQGDSSIRLNPTTVESFRIAQKFLSDAGIPYHTFALPEEKELKVQIIGIPADTTPEFIYNELVSLGFKVNSVTPLFSPGKKLARNAFLVKIRKVGDYQAIYEINMLFFLKVRVEAFEAQAGPKQCYNCQRYGHSSAFCHHPTRCLRCGDSHRKDTCCLLYTSRCV